MRRPINIYDLFHNAKWPLVTKLHHHKWGFQRTFSMGIETGSILLSIKGSNKFEGTYACNSHGTLTSLVLTDLVKNENCVRLTLACT